MANKYEGLFIRNNFQNKSTICQGTPLTDVFS